MARIVADPVALPQDQQHPTLDHEKLILTNRPVTRQ
jgi:hypothetical protein